MTNFDFLKKEGQFSAFSDACIEAEQSISVSPALCALGVRKSAELAVKWLYSVDKTLKLPYKDNFSALVYNQSFLDSIDKHILDRLKYIIKLGNFSAHTSTQVTYKEAVLSLANLFDFVLFIDYCYGKAYEERTFDESLLAADSKRKISAAEFERMKNLLEEQSKERERMAEEVKKLRDSLDTLRKQNEGRRHYSTSDKTEAETRRSIIDIDIKSMGWTFDKDCFTEVPVVGMPSPSGTGSADYVLYGEDGKPLAVVEAKRTSVDPEEGKQQAYEYARCLAETTGQMPFIFYTNGYTTWLWDYGNYVPRKVYSVFSKADLSHMVVRRSLIKPFQQLNINPEITDRYYQKMAIQMVCNDFADKRRKALLVMATGTGKTRVSISLVDVLQTHRWITNILFLADRVELVKQAKKDFVKRLPNLTTCNLMERGDGRPTDRAVFSTYPTIMNAINDATTDDGEKLFTPGHFDLIIIDEAHRSIFKKYRAIFEYFDALLVGLTATPKDEVGRNTYEFFDLQDNMPTYAYEYEKARDDGFLVDYHCLEKLYRIPTEGLSREDLTPEQREQFEEAFDEDDEVPDFISGADIDTKYFNEYTTRRILSEVMEKGLKVEGGDKLGKTIIFAKRHDHAVFIEKQFNILYPQYGGLFARVIDQKVKYSDQLLEDFKDPAKMPQIAISVDMLDTGIDVPEVVNLVFYKQVFSKTKFWQMFGRGTRLCEDLFEPGQDKKEFYIFDYMGNFEFFSQNPQGKEPSDTDSIAAKVFSLKVQIVRELQRMEYQTEELIPFRRSIVEDLSSSIAALNREQFQVRQQLEYVEKYGSQNAFQCLEIVESERLISNLSNLMPQADGDEFARRFDVMMYHVMLAKAAGESEKYERYAKTIRQSAQVLEQKGSIPEVYAARETLSKIKGNAFWTVATLPELEEIRLELRDLMHFLRKEYKSKVINVTDSVIFEREGERFTQESSLESYYERANRYVEENMNEPVLQKLRNNIPLKPEDWDALERIFWNEVGTEAEYREATHINGDDAVMPLGQFVRSLTGLDKETANQAFSEFLDTGMYTKDQVFFVRCIVDYITEYGTLDQKVMADNEFANGLSVVTVFGDNIAAFEKIKRVIAGINANAMPLAA